MRIVLLPYGSLGDVLPYLGLGLRLQQRGHDVTLATNGFFAHLVQRAGLDFHEIGSAEDYLRVSSLVEGTSAIRSTRIFALHMLLPLIRRQFTAIEALAQGRTLLVSSSMGVGARLAHEALGLPLVTLQLYPRGFWSQYQPPKLGQSPLAGDWVPGWVQSLKYRAIITFFYDRYLLSPINELRAQLGLSPIRTAIEMSFSPQRVVAMFPDWFAPRQPDWPAQVVNTGFPLWDLGEAPALESGLEEFLAAGDPPLVFTHGSHICDAKAYFLAAATACQRLGRRGLLCTSLRHQIPDDLPDGVRHLDYAPFSQLLPRCGALISHGGIGTLSAALAAGIPQVVMPMVADQFDNAARLRRLGVGEVLWTKNFRAPAVVRVLDRLLSSAQVQERCRELAQRLRGQDALGATCDLIESAGSQGVTLNACPCG